MKVNLILNKTNVNKYVNIKEAIGNALIYLLLE
jgi:hypothetical protein